MGDLPQVWVSFTEHAQEPQIGITPEEATALLKLDADCRTPGGVFDSERWVTGVRAILAQQRPGIHFPLGRSYELKIRR